MIISSILFIKICIYWHVDLTIINISTVKGYVLCKDAVGETTRDLHVVINSDQNQA